MGYKALNFVVFAFLWFEKLSKKKQRTIGLPLHNIPVIQPEAYGGNNTDAKNNYPDI